MLKLAELNRLSADEFTRVIGPVFEHSPHFAQRACNERPFTSVDALHGALCTAVKNASEAEKLALIRAHPDLVGRATLTSESQAEQASAGLTDLSSSERETFRHYNEHYRERFGFPFVICARLNKKDAILQAFPRRLTNSSEQEVDITLQEIFKIAELRLRDVVSE